MATVNRASGSSVDDASSSATFGSVNRASGSSVDDARLSATFGLFSSQPTDSQGVSDNPTLKRSPRRQTWRTRLSNVQEVAHAKMATYSKNTLRQLSTSLSLFWIRGTLLSNGIILLEQLIIMILIGMFFCVGYFSKFSAGILADLVPDLRYTIAFPLALYLSLSVRRWYVLRYEGLEKLQISMLKLIMVVSQCSQNGHNRKGISSIFRYSRASLSLIFMERRRIQDPLDKLLARGILDADEVEQLACCVDNAAECLWTWICGVIHLLLTKGTLNDTCYYICLNAVEDGRSAIQHIKAQHLSPIPFQYVHLLAFVVKLHNLSIAAATGLAVGDAFQFQSANDATYFEMAQLIVKSLFITFVFNAMLIICQELQFPFDGYLSGFPFLMYDESVLFGAESYIAASVSRPSWMQLAEAYSYDCRNERPTLLRNLGSQVEESSADYTYSRKLGSQVESSAVESSADNTYCRRLGSQVESSADYTSYV